MGEAEEIDGRGGGDIYIDGKLTFKIQTTYTNLTTANGTRWIRVTVDAIDSAA